MKTAKTVEKRKSGAALLTFTRNYPQPGRLKLGSKNVKTVQKCKNGVFCMHKNVFYQEFHRT